MEEQSEKSEQSASPVPPGQGAKKKSKENRSPLEQYVHTAFIAACVLGAVLVVFAMVYGSAYSRVEDITSFSREYPSLYKDGYDPDESYSDEDYEDDEYYSDESDSDDEDAYYSASSLESAKAAMTFSQALVEIAGVGFGFSLLMLLEGKLLLAYKRS
jgi:hypothetical protein